jgi:hypothetical protein
MTKGETLYKDMKALGEIGQIYERHGEEVEVGHGHGQRGSNIKQ